MASPIGRVLLMDKGAYNGSTVYNQLDWVRYNGAAWVCKVNGTVGVQPVEGANWTLMAQDGNVSGSVEWSTGVLHKPFENIGSGLSVDGSDNLNLDVSYLTGSNIGYDNTASGLTASDVQEAIDELAGMTVDLTTDLLAGSNITLTPKPDGKVEIASTGGGGGGASSLDDLSDVSIDTATLDDGQILAYNLTDQEFQNVDMPDGGHNMIPDPADVPAPDEDDVVNAVQGALTEGGTNDDVLSAYGVGVWANTDTIKLLTTVAQGDDTVGTWEDDATWESGSRAYWLKHESLHGILSDDDVEISLVFDVADGEAISCLAYRIDDAITSSLGGIAIKFNAPVQNANGATVGVVLKHNRTKTSVISRTS